jgi:hypothetical protein
METVSKLESLDTNTLKLILKNALDEKREKAQGDFLTFVKTVWPDFVLKESIIKYMQRS